MYPFWHVYVTDCRKYKLVLSFVASATLGVAPQDITEKESFNFISKDNASQLSGLVEEPQPAAEEVLGSN